MSFAEQERALFDLLFDAQLRAAFCREGPKALQNYVLDKKEQADFAAIRPDALVMDAAMRINLIMAHLGRDFPLSFSLLSSLENGPALLQKPLGPALIQTEPAQRPALYGQQLAAFVPQNAFADEQQYRAAMAIIAAETALCFSAARLRHALASGEQNPAIGVAENWQEKALSLGDYVSAFILPRPYQTLRQKLCPASGTALWQHLKKSPLPAFMRDEILSVEESVFVLSQARVRTDSPTDPVIDYKTMALSRGYAPIFQYVNGSMSCKQILAHLQQAGAAEALLASVEHQLGELLQAGMIKT